MSCVFDKVSLSYVQSISGSWLVGIRIQFPYTNMNYDNVIGKFVLSNIFSKLTTKFICKFHMIFIQLIHDGANPPCQRVFLLLSRDRTERNAHLGDHQEILRGVEAVQSDSFADWGVRLVLPCCDVLGGAGKR